MRYGLAPSLLLHAAIAAAGWVVLPSALEELNEEELIIVPIELVEISDSTNLRAPQPDPVPEPEPPKQPDPEPEPEPEPEPPPPEDEPDAPDDQLGEEDETLVSSDPEPEPEPEPEVIDPEPEAEPEPKPTPKEVDEPAPRPTVDKSFLDSVLKSAKDKREERNAERERREAADLKKVQDAILSQRSAGDRERDTATWTAALKSKLEKEWRDPSDMANAERLRVSYKIVFNRDGTLRRPPQRIKPATIPPSDQQMLVFDINAVRAIQKAAPYDDIFPDELYEEWKEFTFNFGKSSQ